MAALGRRSFLGLAGASAVVLGTRPVLGGQTLVETGYKGEIAILGLGNGEGASVSVAWLPTTGDDVPRSARLVILGLNGTPLAVKHVELAPFTGATLRYELPEGPRRRSVIGYVFLDRVDEIYATLEVYDVASGRTTKFAGDPVG
jgi:hypothetical protein